MKEIWKTIEGFENYQVSNMGRVKNIKTGHILKPFLRGSRENNKYYSVELKGKAYFIHRLVAKAFLPNPDNLPQVNHKDENKLNNEITNLEYCTQSENRRYSIERGSIVYKTGLNNSVSKLTREQVEYIKINYRKGDHTFGGIALAKRFGVHKKTIYNIINGKHYTEVII